MEAGKPVDARNGPRFIFRKSTDADFSCPMKHKMSTKAHVLKEN